MPDVVVRIAAIDVRIGERTWSIQLRGKRVARRIVDRMRKAVRGQRFETPRQTALELELERLIVRSCRAGGERDVREVRGEIGELRDAQQVPAGRAHIRQRN